MGPWTDRPRLAALPPLAPVARILRRYWPVVLGAALLVPHAAYFDFLTDDAYISFRYARNLAEHGELTFNLGDRVEGFTNFLWTVLLALGIRLGASPIVSSRFLGMGFAVATFGVAVWLSLRLSRDRPSAWHAVAPVTLALTSGFACWVSGGLETQLFTFLAFAACASLCVELDSGRGFASGALFALAAMTRPEGALLFAIAGAFRVARNCFALRRLWPTRTELLWGATFAALFVPYFAGRWLYFGWAFPNTFYVKAAGSQGTVPLGLFYLRRFAEDHFLIALLPLVLVGARAPAASPLRRALFLLTGVLWVVFLIYVVRVGGDFMGLYRFVLPLLPLGAVCLQEALRTLAERLRPWLLRPALAITGLALCGGYAFGNARLSHRGAVTFVAAENHMIDSPAYLKSYVADRVPIGRWMRLHAKPDDVVAVGGAGVIPYYSGIRSYDVYGLVDSVIAHDPGATVGARPGHQKWGEGHLLAQRPTLIMFRYCLHAPCDQEQTFRPAGYEWVRATIPGLDPPYYSFLKRIDRAFGPFPAR